MVPTQRLIPAHAGKTGRQRSDLQRSPAHPRSRGENQVVQAGGGKLAGSSPLTRGKRRSRHQRLRSRRLIPAHAGKTRGTTSSACPARAHPRSRGENVGGGLGKHLGGGSSPLTRGKPYKDALDKREFRLIPAHAGKTSTSRAASSRSRAHPRSRGENPKTRSDRLPDPGSSPLTRGKRRRRGGRCRGGRLIPAHAGKTDYRLGRVGEDRAHPRSRGENALVGLFLGLPAGSSPLTRGKRSFCGSLC